MGSLPLAFNVAVHGLVSMKERKVVGNKAFRDRHKISNLSSNTTYKAPEFPCFK
jgi:hypothetical protein